MCKKLFFWSAAIFSFLLLFSPHAEARVKLVALPERARVVVSLTNPNATLVEEERLITLQKGENQVDFSWRGVGIDTGSIQARMLGEADRVTILSTSYPPNENALIWSIHSPVAKEERVRISYLVNGLQREVFYKAVAEPDEKALTLRTYLRLRNNSGEDLDHADISVGYGEQFNRDLAHEGVLELLSEKVDGLPIKKLLTWDSVELPWDPEYEKNTIGIPLTYVLTNNPSSKLGKHTLLPGKARIFLKSKDGAGDAQKENVTFTGEDWAALTPSDRELKLYTGQSREVKVTQRQTKNDRTNIRHNNHQQDVMWDTDEEYKVEVENFKKTAVDLVIVEHFPGYWKMVDSSHKYEKKDAFEIRFPLTLPPQSSGTNKTTITFHLNRLNVNGQEISSY